MPDFLKSASGRIAGAVNPLSLMDPKDRQKAKDKAKHLGGNLGDKMDVMMSKIRRDDGVVIDVAVIKATIQQPKPPKEKHVAVLKMACSGASPRMQVAYTVHQLAARLEDKPGWLVALKTLMVFHRLMGEVDPSFQDEMIAYQMRTGKHRLLRLDNFADQTTKETWDHAAWIRVYSTYLDERLAAFKSIRYDPESHNALNPADFCRLEACTPSELLDKLPVVQRLLGQLIKCVPEGAAAQNEISLQAAALVLREVRSVYQAVSKGIINLTDKFFDMDRSDALRGLDIFKENMQVNDRLNAFFGAINSVTALRGATEFPALQSLPTDFLGTMEEYVRDAKANPAKAGPTGAGFNTLPSSNRASEVARQGGATSGAITGATTSTENGSALPPTFPSPTATTVTTTAPTTEPTPISPPAPTPAQAQAPPAPPPNAIDLLSDDFPLPAAPQPPASSFGQSSSFAQPPAPPSSFAQPPPFAGPTGGYGAPPPYAGPTGGVPPPYAGPTGGYGAPPPYAGPTGGYGAPPPYAGPTGGYGAPLPYAGPTGGYGAPPPYAGPTGGYGAPPPAFPQAPPALPAPPTGFDDSSFGIPATATNQLTPFNPFGAPLAPSQPEHNPMFSPSQMNPYGGLSMPPALPPPSTSQQQPFGAPATNPYGGMMQAPPAAPSTFGVSSSAIANPFDAPPAFSMPQQQPAFAQQPPQAASWNTAATQPAQKAAVYHDPLSDLSLDLFSQPQQVVQPSLKDLRVSGAM